MIGGTIILKHIILQGVNDNAGDAAGFMEVAKRADANVIISRNGLIWYTPIDKSEYKTVSQLVGQCKEAGITQSFSLELLHDNDIKRLVAI